VPTRLSLHGVGVDVTGRALLVVVLPDGAIGGAAAAAVRGGADVVELDAGEGSVLAVAGPDGVAAAVAEVLELGGVPVVVRTSHPGLAGAAVGAGAGVDLRAGWRDPGLIPAVGPAAGPVVVEVPTGSGPDGRPVVTVPPPLAGLAAGTLVVEPVGTGGPWAVRPDAVLGWSAEPGGGSGPRALAAAALAVAAGCRWLRVPTADGFRQGRDVLGAVLAARERRRGMAG
jgi:hypothetical protein